MTVLLFIIHNWLLNGGNLVSIRRQFVPNQLVLECECSPRVPKVLLEGHGPWLGSTLKFSNVGQIGKISVWTFDKISIFEKILVFD